jgi:hypothetical protein
MLKLKGKFHAQHVRAGKVIAEYDFPNGIVDEGLNHILDTEFHGGAAVATWYIGLVDNAGWTAFANADVMNNHAGWIECADYDETDRPAWTEGAAAARSMTNSVTVDFSINATVTLKGIFITSSLTKGGASGVLWSTGAFGSTVPLNGGDSLKVTYTISG